MTYDYIILYGEGVIHLGDCAPINLLRAMNTFDLLAESYQHSSTTFCRGPLNALFSRVLASFTLVFT
jgi:hypothetical protein